MKSENATPSGSFTEYLSCPEMATPLTTAITSNTVETISTLLPLMVRPSLVWFLLARKRASTPQDSQCALLRRPKAPRDAIGAGYRTQRIVAGAMPRARAIGRVAVLYDCLMTAVAPEDGRV